jgi:sulfatase maturation enzyme AslB (radical SAM superfamily)
MKPLVWITLLGITFELTIASCNNEQNPAQQYGNTMVQSLKSAKKLDATVNVLEVKKSIQEFYAANSRYPTDLNELSTFNGMTLKSDQFDYDPATGSLTEKR